MEVSKLKEGLSAQADLMQLSDLPDSIRDRIQNAPDHLCDHDGRIYLLLNQSVISCPNTESGRNLIFLILNKQVSDSFPQSRSEFMYHCLVNPGMIQEPVSLSRFCIRDSVPRCVILFQNSSFSGRDMLSLLTSVAPLDSEDIPVSIDFRKTALVKNLAGQSIEDVSEYAAAVIGTLEDEGFPGIRAGIGREVSQLADLRNSYLEAWNALCLGRRYHPETIVHQYSQQALERIIDSIPAEKRILFRKELLSKNGDNGLTDELMETVREFFRNDLNLAATSKQLFIHRNTLNYRLDKIRKEYGLDLRKFQDAVIFKVLTEMPEK